MVLLNLYFYTNQIHGGIISRLFFVVLSLHMLALHLAVKMCFQIFLYEEFEHVIIHTSVQLCFPPECNQDRTLLRNQYY